MVRKGKGVLGAAVRLAEDPAAQAMGCGQQRGEGREKNSVREGRKEAFRLWSCSYINGKIFPGPDKTLCDLAPALLSHMVYPASLTFWTPDKGGFLQMHH